jgi:hypothetical protein
VLGLHPVKGLQKFSGHRLSAVASLRVLTTTLTAPVRRVATRRSEKKLVTVRTVIFHCENSHKSRCDESLLVTRDVRLFAVKPKPKMARVCSARFQVVSDDSTRAFDWHHLGPKSPTAFGLVYFVAQCTIFIFLDVDTSEYRLRRARNLQVESVHGFHDMLQPTASVPTIRA